MTLLRPRAPSSKMEGPHQNTKHFTSWIIVCVSSLNLIDVTFQTVRRATQSKAKQKQKSQADHHLCLQSQLDRRHFQNGAESHAIESETKAEVSKLDHRLRLQSKLDRRHFRNGAESHVIKAGPKLKSQQNQSLRKLSKRRCNKHRRTIRTVALSKRIQSFDKEEYIGY